MLVTLKDVEEKIEPLGGKLSYDRDFIFELLAAYGRSSSNITRLRNGQLNVADDKEHEVAQKNVVYFKPATGELYPIIDDLQSSPTVVRYSTRFVIVTDYQHLLAIDTKTNETLDIAIRDINKHYAFFLPWAGMEKAQFIAENHADVKAAEKMARLFDILVAHNGYTTPLEWHNLTTFFTRLLFCLFAEDTHIFKKNQFSHAIASYTQEDGSDLEKFLKVLFASLDDEDKEGYPAHLASFPYVNGQLFRDFTQIPDFNKEARDLLIESASKLDWSEINPDIFGSMFQTVVRPGERTSLGQHYTSVPNIMKTIEPLFLDELRAEFDKGYDDVAKLDRLLGRIGSIRIFDPACGSGNFLIIAYKELRKLEHAIMERQSELTGQTQQVLLGSRVNVSSFCGIEIDDFAHEVAILSLWLAKHQMNLEFTEKFGVDLPLIPLRESGNIKHGNAARLNWSDICPNNGRDEIYLIGNPPYKGGKSIKEKSQKEDVRLAFNGRTYSKNVDYISIWFLKGAEYISNSSAKLAFVSTNSVCQGEQVEIFWPYVFEYGLEISFAYTSFQWGNRAKGSAGVTCVIVGLASENVVKEKRINTNGLVISCRRINAYLVPDGPDIIVGKRSAALSSVLPHISLGSMPKDGGHLVLTKQERNDLVAKAPEAAHFLKKFMGSADFIRGEDRYCIWVTDAQYEEAKSIPFFRERFEKVAKFRLASDAGSTQAFAKRPYRFIQIGHKNTDSIIIPRVSSERRDYIPIGYQTKGTIIADSANAIYDAKPYVFGLVTSRMHMAWVRAVAGRLKTDFRYSSAIVYNSFPVPVLAAGETIGLEKKAFEVLDTRELYPEKTLANLYAPDKMPNDLRLAHQELDDLVDSIYRKRPFESDEERLSLLFEIYEQMIELEREIV
jgi:hypothetical protein